MRQQMHPQIEVAGFGGALPFTLDPDARAFDHARRDLDLDLAACRANPGTAAGRAGDALHHGAIAHPAPFTDKARSAAGGAGLRHLGLDGSLATLCRLLERDLDGMLDVLASLPGDG